MKSITSTYTKLKMSNSKFEIPFSILFRGKFIIGFSSIIVFSIVFLMKFPEKLTGTVTLFSNNPAIAVFPKTSSEVDSLFYESGDFIKRGNVIAILKSTAKYNDVIKLEKSLSNSDYELDTDLELGELAPFFTRYLEYSQRLMKYKVERNTQAKIKLLEMEKNKYLEINKLLKKNLNISFRELKISEKNYNRHTKLNKNGTISISDIEKIETDYLQQQKSIEDLRVKIKNNENKIIHISSEIIILQEAKENSIQEYDLKKKEAFSIMITEIRKWKDKYILIAPLSGTIILRNVRSKNEHIDLSIPFCKIKPEKENKIIALGKLPAFKVGKITSESKAIIKLSNFPYKEFGVLEGKISNPMLITKEDDFYHIEIDLTNNLKTSSGFKIDFNTEMSGNLEVIIEKRSLFQQITDYTINELI